MCNRRKEKDMRSATNGHKVNITIDRDVEDWAREKAQEENRTFSNFVETVMKKYKKAVEEDKS